MSVSNSENIRLILLGSLYTLTRQYVSHGRPLHSTYLPGDRQPANSDVAQAHDDREERVQVSILFAASADEETFVGYRTREMLDVLGRKLDEFSQELHTFARAGRQAYLRDDPVLDLVESSHERVEVSCDLAVLVPAKDLIEKLMLQPTKRHVRLW